MMLHLYHGRTKASGGATDVDGNPIEDWGFDGPALLGVKALSCTYGVHYVHFQSKAAHAVAKEQTGWKDGVFEESLEMRFRGDCVSIRNKARNRLEYFGDWSLAEGKQL